MLCSIYFSLYWVPSLLMPFYSPEVVTTPTMHNGNSLIDIYVWDLYAYACDFDVYGWHFYVYG
jgi:hypothetical protein